MRASGIRTLAFPAIDKAVARRRSVVYCAAQRAEKPYERRTASAQAAARLTAAPQLSKCRRATSLSQTN